MNDSEIKAFKERLDAATHSYIGRLPCGCVVAAVVDMGDKDTARDVAGFIKQGLTIERVTHDYVREHLTFRCPHKEPIQPRLFDEVQS